MRLSATLLLLICSHVFAQNDQEAFSGEQLLQERLKAHIEFLAADELRGREPGTAGYEIAASYVASQFRQMGLVPAGSENSYFQQVPLRRAFLQENSAKMSLATEGKTRDFEFVTEFFRGASLNFTESTITAEMVFIGYGIDSPELDYSDFEGIDLEGKIAVTIAGQPKRFPSEEGAHFGSGREKQKALISHGAVGWVTVYTPRIEKMFKWERARLSLGKASMDWLTETGQPFSSNVQLLGSSYIHYKAGAALFKGSDHSLKELIAMDAAGENPPVFPLKGKLTLAQSSRHEVITSPNVVAFLPGSDPVLSSEFVVYSAHLDHIGELVGHGHKDAINNGALDNASGVSVMLETARLFTQREKPRRSILFVAVTAEEKGLIGSEYYAQNPTVPIESMVGLINLDMPVLLYDFGDVTAFGAEHSTLGEVMKQAAEEFEIALTPDPMPQQNIFVRSDHYRFVQVGVPAVFLVTGWKASSDGEDNQQVFDDFLQNHYHRVTDDLNQPINYSAAARFTRINARAGEIIADQTERPAWHEGDFFGDTFKR